MTPVIPYARYGRQFTQWDAYRYEEIVDQGYIYHQPPNTEKEAEQQKAENRMKDPAAPPDAELRWKNVVWYPLYPLLAWIVSHGLHIPSTLALTVVSWTCCFFASIIFFLYARRHFYNRQLRVAPPAGATEVMPSAITLPSPEQPALHDVAATLAVTAVCSVLARYSFTRISRRVSSSFCWRRSCVSACNPAGGGVPP